ncbi:MAG: hypothetical protein AABZ15_01560 [Nitrospirota bacterium]
MMTKKKTIHLSAILVVAAVLAACSSGGGGSGSAGPSAKIQLSGTISSFSYTLPTANVSFSKFARLFSLVDTAWAAVAPTVDQIMAIPIMAGTGSIDAGNFSFAQTTAVKNNGTFSITLDRRITVPGYGVFDVSWVLLLMDTAAPNKADRIVGFVAVGDAINNMISIPIFDANGSIALGILTANGVEALSSVTLADTQGKFNYTLAQLQELARTDDFLKNIRNIYANYDAATGTFYNMNMSFVWYGVPAAINNTFSAPDAFTAEGYQVQIFTNNTTTPSFSSVCTNTAASKQIIALSPPSDVHLVTTTTTTFGSARPISNDRELDLSRMPGQCASQWPDQAIFMRDDATQLFYNFITGDRDLLAPPIASGTWGLKTGPSTTTSRTELAAFDMAAANPLTATLQPITYVPSLKVTTAAGAITAIDIEWYLWNSSLATPAYVKLIDATILQKQINAFSVYMADYSGTIGSGGAGIEENIIDIPVTGASQRITSAQFTRGAWRFFGDPSSDDPVVVNLFAQYSLYGMTFRFGWR